MPCARPGAGHAIAQTASEMGEAFLSRRLNLIFSSLLRRNFIDKLVAGEICPDKFAFVKILTGRNGLKHHYSVIAWYVRNNPKGHLRDRAPADFLVYAHPLLFMPWLGADVGVFSPGQHFRKRNDYTVEQRVALLKLLLSIDNDAAQRMGAH